MTGAARWLGGAPGRIVVHLLAIASLGVSLFVGYRYVELTECLRSAAAADARRTAVISAATDVERRIERELLAPGGPPEAERDAVLAARDHVDEVRAANPPIRVACG